jgi:hypothetical protein
MSPKNGGQSCVSARADKCQEFARRPDRRRRAARQAFLDKVDQGFRYRPRTKKKHGPPAIVEELSTSKVGTTSSCSCASKPSSLLPYNGCRFRAFASFVTPFVFDTTQQATSAFSLDRRFSLRSLLLLRSIFYSFRKERK